VSRPGFAIAPVETRVRARVGYRPWYWLASWWPPEAGTDPAPPGILWKYHPPESTSGERSTKKRSFDLTPRVDGATGEPTLRCWAVGTRGGLPHAA
jgi:hypothetical protein